MRPHPVRMKQGVIPGVNLARTVPPAMPANFLSRKHLFHLFETNMPGATIIAAPAGYGKTMLVAEWAAAQSRPTILVPLFGAQLIQMIHRKCFFHTSCKRLEMFCLNLVLILKVKDFCLQIAT
ncbi:MAG: hypothetical protein EBT26_11535 [Microbacteriaceae bacterium]|nr:hypothetical protein [Microbacteriaceae bacterium]